MRLIDADALLKLIEETNDEKEWMINQYNADWIYSMIDSAPTIDPKPVKHGRWIGLEYDGYADGYPVYDLWECSECGEEVSGEDVPITHPYCHGCGAKMDGDSNG